jgi:hypothetical protein
MTKTEAIALLGGSQAAAAVKIGVTFQAIGHWPEELSPKLRDRVQAALYREHMLHVVAVAKTRARSRAKSRQGSSYVRAQAIVEAVEAKAAGVEQPSGPVQPS